MAHVSIATVSYVMNNRMDKRIPDATRKKVMQAANFLNYTPNPYAVGLSTNLAHNIAVRTSPGSCSLQNMETMIFLQDFNETAVKNNYCLSYLPNKVPEKIGASACICMDFSKEEFYLLGNENLIPLIAIDAVLNDPFFYQINSDYGKIQTTAAAHFNSRFTYCAIMPNNAELRTEILDTFDSVIFVSDIKDLFSVSPLNSHLVVNQPTLFGAFDFLKTADIFKYDAHLVSRKQAIFDSIEKAINRVITENQEHFIKL